MSTKTRRQLVEQALNILVPLSGQAHAAEDVASMDGYVDSVLDDLAIRKVYYVQDDDEIEPAPFVHLAKCLAFAAKDEFGGGNVDVLLSEQRLRELASSDRTFAPLQADYF